MSGAAAKEGVVIFMIKNNSLYISLRLNTPCYNNMWQCCGGGIEPGESNIEAAQRELKEETGLSVVSKRLIPWGFDGYAEAPFGKSFGLHYFAIELREEEVPQNTEPHLHGDWELVQKYDVLNRDVLPGLRSAIAREMYFSS